MPDSTKAFVFASKAAAGDNIVESFEIDGASYDIRALPDAQVAYLIHKFDSGAADVQLRAVLDFMGKALTAESAKRFEARVLQVPDGLTMVQVVEVFQYVVGVVSAFPTGSATGSSTPPRRGGPGSRATRTAQA